MTIVKHFLDDLPLDFSKPALQDLLGLLRDNYPSARAATPLIQQSQIDLSLLNLDQPMAYAWPEILVEARKRNRLRPLLEVITQQDTAVSPRIIELLGADPVLPVEPPERTEWKFDSLDGRMLERQIESQRSLLDVAFLKRGLELAPSVVRLLVRLSDGEYYGTAFRIAEHLLLTNYHVLFDPVGQATQVEAWFGYERSFAGAVPSHQIISCEPASILGAADHDWAVVRTATQMPLTAEVIPITGARVPEESDRVYIIQHPNGGVKKIGMAHNTIIEVTTDTVRYLTDTEGGSSGSPVFNEQWELVALHNRWGSRQVAGRTEYFNEGRRIERVAQALRDARVL